MKKILVPIDGSQNSFNALKYAGEIAEKYSAELVLVNIQKPVFYESLESETEETETLQDRAKMIIKEGLKVLKGSPIKIKPEFNSEIILGDPAEQILFLIKKENVDMVVMGRKGLSGIKRYVIGSVSHKVLQHSPITVLIVK